MPAFYTWVGDAVYKGYLKKERGENDGEEVASATEFFSEKIRSGSMKLDGLPLVGYQFLRDQFKEQNLKGNNGANIEEVSKCTKPKKQNKINQKRPIQEEDALFEIRKPPSELKMLDMVWAIALNSQKDEQVVKESIGLLINCYLSINEKYEKFNPTIRAESCNEFTQKIFQKLEEHKDDIRMTKRLILILTWLIKISEKQGLNIQPHNALIRGELLQRVNVNFYVDDAQDYTKKILDR